MAYIEQIMFTNPSGQILSPSTEDMQRIMTLLLDRLEYGMLTDTSKRLRIVIDGGTVSLPTTQDIRNITGTMNITRVGDIQTQRLVEAQYDSAFILGITNNINF